MLNKAFTLAIGIVVLTTVAVRAAGPPPNDVKLSATPNVASRGGCLVTAWVHNGNYSNSGYPVYFHQVPPGPTVPSWATGTSNAAGKASVLVPWGKKIVATVPSQTLLTSNFFTCPSKNPNE
jgi:hypothetical protein